MPIETVFIITIVSITLRFVLQPFFLFDEILIEILWHRVDILEHRFLAISFIQL